MDGKREEGGVEANKPLLLSFLCAVIAMHERTLKRAVSQTETNTI